MNARPTHKLLAAGFLLSLSAALPAQPPEPAPPVGETKIQVFVYNYAGVSPETLARAKREATRIYSHAGIKTEWLDCPLTPDQAAQFPACQLPVSSAPLVLRILSRSMAEGIGLSQITFGFAVLPEDGGYGTIAQVCAHCCEELARGGEAPSAAILGHVMAHEIGHLLLGVGSHGATGLMHVPWDKKELQGVAQGSPLFTAEEAGKMRRQVAERLSGAVPVPESKIQVLVHNFAGVSAETLAQAEREAARIYKHAGIELNWLDCTFGPGGPAQTPACQLLPSPDRPVLRLLPGSMDQWRGVPKGATGFALVPTDGGFGTHAQVCAQCCEKLAKGDKTMHAPILGHVMAHELGHLLLGANGHGPAGLMHCPWDKKELEMVAQGALLFTASEGEKMRRQVAERLSGAMVAKGREM